MRVLNSTYDPIVTSLFNEIITPSRGNPTAFSTEVETYIKDARINSKREMGMIRVLYEKLQGLCDYNNIKRIYPMIFNTITSSTLGNMTGSPLSVSGDYTEEAGGLSGDGLSTYFRSGFLADSITDINNFTIFVLCTASTNSGTDIGCDDNTDSLKIILKDGGNCDMMVGTASAQFPNDDGKGLYAMNVRSGTIYAYKNGVEQANAAVAGGLPNKELYVAANNDNGSPASYCGRRYGMIIIYDGRLSDNQQRYISILIHQWSEINNRYYG